MVIQSRPVHLLLTRPRLQGQRFVRQLRAGLDHNFRVIFAPLLSPVFLHPALPLETFTAVIFTSETAVAASCAMCSLPKAAFCVGDQTARAARRAGFTTRSAAGDAEALVRLIIDTAPSGPLLHLHGADTRGDIASRLNSAGIETHAMTVYRQEPGILSPAARRLLNMDAPAIVPLFSPRTARIFSSQLEPTMPAPLYVVAISAAVAQVVQGQSIRDVRIAVEPTAEAMIAGIGQIADIFPVA